MLTSMTKKQQKKTFSYSLKRFGGWSCRKGIGDLHSEQLTDDSLLKQGGGSGGK